MVESRRLSGFEGIAERVRVENGTVYVSPPNVIKITYSPAKFKGLVMLNHSTLIGLWTGKNNENGPVFVTAENTSYSAKRISNQKEFVISSGTKFTVPSVTSLGTIEYHNI